jgi:hypothetical protein
MSKNILLKRDSIQDFLKHKNFVPTLMILILKLYIWCIVKLDVYIIDEEKENAVNMVKNFHKLIRDQIKQGKPMFTLNVSIKNIKTY